MVLGLCAAAALLAGGTAAAEQFFGVWVVDKQTQRGVPRVTLTAMGNEVFTTDSAGWAAIPTLGYGGQETFFTIESDGYRGSRARTPSATLGSRCWSFPGQTARWRWSGRSGPSGSTASPGSGYIGILCSSGFPAPPRSPF